MTGSPFQRAQEKFRPILKPKNPLRRQNACSGQEIVAPRSPTFTSSTSNSSSISGHGMQTSTSTSSFTSSTSASSSSSSSTAAAVAKIRIGDQKISLPLLATAGVSIFVVSLVLRALYTFGTSLLRLFVLLVFVVAALSFSSFSEKQQLSAHRKRAVEAALNGDRRSHYTNAHADDDRLNAPSLSSYQTATTPIASPYSQAASTAPLTIKSQASSYGHAKYNSAYSTKTTIATTTATTHHPSAPVYSSDGSRSRQLLTAHQRSPTYA